MIVSCREITLISSYDQHGNLASLNDLFCLPLSEEQQNLFEERWIVVTKVEMNRQKSPFKCVSIVSYRAATTTSNKRTKCTQLCRSRFARSTFYLAPAEDSTWSRKTPTLPVQPRTRRWTWVLAELVPVPIYSPPESLSNILPSRKLISWERQSIRFRLCSDLYVYRYDFASARIMEFLKRHDHGRFP